MSKSLMIDAGHGGSDPGTSGFGEKEKDWTLKMSNYQYDRLKQLGAKVGITRTTDKTLDSVARTNVIKNKYDYCMSNHFNSFNGSARGVEVIYSIYSNEKIAKRIADAIVRASKLPFRRVFDRAGTNGDYYFMHRLTGATDTIIVEYGFLDNQADYNFYKNSVNFYRVAEAVVKEWCAILGVKYIPKDEGQTQTAKTYQVLRSLDGFVTADEAKTHKNKKTTIRPNKYYIYKEASGMINITTKQGVPGSWINPADNQPLNKPSANTFFIRTKPASLYYYNQPNWNAKVGTVKKGTVLTVVETLTVNGSKMYKLKSGTYITANPEYVERV